MKITYRKLPIPTKPFNMYLKALYEVRVDGRAVGTVHKHMENTWTNHGTRGGSGQRTRDMVVWVAKATGGTKEYEYETRKGAVKEMIEALEDQS